MCKFCSTGCWLSADENRCTSEVCESTLPPGQKDVHVCCCSGHMCNAHFKDVYDPLTTTTLTTISQPAPEAIGKRLILFLKIKCYFQPFQSQVDVFFNFPLYVLNFEVFYDICKSEIPIINRIRTPKRYETIGMFVRHLKSLY